MVCESAVIRLPGRGSSPGIYFTSFAVSTVLLETTEGICKWMLGVNIFSEICIKVCENSMAGSGLRHVGVTDG